MLLKPKILFFLHTFMETRRASDYCKILAQGHATFNSNQQKVSPLLWLWFHASLLLKWGMICAIFSILLIEVERQQWKIINHYESHHAYASHSYFTEHITYCSSVLGLSNSLCYILLWIFVICCLVCKRGNNNFDMTRLEMVVCWILQPIISLISLELCFVIGDCFFPFEIFMIIKPLCFRLSNLHDLRIFIWKS